MRDCRAKDSGGSGIDHLSAAAKDAEERYLSARDLRLDLPNLLRKLEMGESAQARIGGKRAVAVLPFKLLTPNTRTSIWEWLWRMR